MQHFGAFLIWLATIATNLILVITVYFGLREETRCLIKEPFAKTTTLTAIISAMITCLIILSQS